MHTQRMGKGNRGNRFGDAAFQVTNKNGERFIMAVAVFRHATVMVEIDNILNGHRILGGRARRAFIKDISVRFHFTDGIIDAGAGQSRKFGQCRFGVDLIEGVFLKLIFLMLDLLGQPEKHSF